MPKAADLQSSVHVRSINNGIVHNHDEWILVESEPEALEAFFNGPKAHLS